MPQAASPLPQPGPLRGVPRLRRRHRLHDPHSPVLHCPGAGPLKTSPPAHNHSPAHNHRFPSTRPAESHTASPSRGIPPACPPARCAGWAVLCRAGLRLGGEGRRAARGAQLVHCNVWSYMAFGTIYSSWLTLIHRRPPLPPPATLCTQTGAILQRRRSVFGPGRTPTEMRLRGGGGWGQES